MPALLILLRRHLNCLRWLHGLLHRGLPSYGLQRVSIFKASKLRGLLKAVIVPDYLFEFLERLFEFLRATKYVPGDKFLVFYEPVT